MGKILGQALLYFISTTSFAEGNMLQVLVFAIIEKLMVVYLPVQLIFLFIKLQRFSNKTWKRNLLHQSKQY